MRDVDLSIFRFDYDLTWAGIMLESDGTVLGRYGAGAKDSMRYNSVKGLRRAMERALALHQDLASNKTGLSLKNQGKVEFDRPRKLPSATIKKIIENDTERKNCVHCHNVQEGLNRVIERKPGYHPNDILSLFPTPESFGIVLDADHGLKVKEVLLGTPAAEAGFQVGDELLRIEGQPLISPADVIWALKSVGDPGIAKVEYLRGGELQKSNVSMTKNWKPSDISWRESIHALYPQLKLWLEPASKDKRRRAKVDDTKHLALEVLGVFGDETRKAGLKTGDIITRVGDWQPNANPKEFTAHIRTTYFKKGSRIPLTVVRGKKTLSLILKF